MNRIKELFNAILLKKESLSIINEYNLKKIPLFFLITNIVFPFMFGSGEKSHVSASRKKPIFDKRKEPKLLESDLLFRVIQAVPLQERPLFF